MYTKEDFLNDAYKKHGNKYNYTKVEYVDQLTKVCIICPEHGEFCQTPKAHAKIGYGCRKCGRQVCADKRRKNLESVINDFRKVHGNKYDYSKVEYINAYTKVCIICPEHGEFWQVPHDHLNGAGCPYCGNNRIKEKLSDTKDNFIRKANEVHNNKYDYSKSDYINQNTKITIICPEHGEFYQTPNSHLQGQGCPTCAVEKTKYYRSLKISDFIYRCNNKFNYFYNYSKTDLNNRDENGKVIVTCPEHGDFKTNPSWHLSGHGCPICGIIKQSESTRLTTENFIEKANKIHNNKYNYSKTKYVTNKVKVCIICPEHGKFYQTPDDHLQGKGCPICGNILSKAENEIYEYCCNIIGKDNIIQRDRNIIKPNELDIYIPKFNYAIEYNGLYWHSEKFGKDKNYHLNKLNICKERGIKLLQIFEDEYVNKRNIVYNKIKHILKLNTNLPRIMGRKCIVNLIENKTAEEFLNKYHIQGFVTSTIYLGAYYDEQLIAVMSFKKENKKSNNWELNRFASNYNYICQGVGGKLLKHFVSIYNPDEIKSFADRRWTTDEQNNIYIKLGFKFQCYTSPEYRYFKREDGLIRQHKFGFRKDKLNRKYGLPLSMTENQMTKELGYSRIYDCGLIKYIWKKE